MKQYLTITLLLLSFGLFAQEPKSKNLQQFDQKKIHFGFSLGVNSAHMSVHRKPYNNLRDSLARIDVISQSGFNLGIVSEYHIHKYLGVRFVPTLVFGQRNFDYKFIDPQGDVYIESRIVESTYLDFPVL
ncbi:MAG: outer membrane beta-barrel protein, partial [Vicingaceae bacterium]